MESIGQAAAAFLAQKRIAVTGVSRHGSDHGANTVYRRLRSSGYEVFPVNPNAERVEGDAAFPDLRSIPGGVDAVLIGTRPDAALDTMRECAELGVGHVWMHRGPGPGSVSEAATRFGREHGITVIDGGCPLMFAPLADLGHRVMKVVYSSHVPKQVWTPESPEAAPVMPIQSAEHTAPASRSRLRGWFALVLSVIVLGWSIVELVSLTIRHTSGPELYGVLVASLAVVAGAGSVALLTSTRGRPWAMATVLLLWLVVGLGGLAGSIAHIAGMPADLGVVDLRPRPAAAPLIFALLGVIGAAAVYLGERAGAPRRREA